MPRGTPAAARTVGVLNLLGASPGRPLGLTEVARRIGISKGSAHALVTTLVEAGYLVRHPADKTYALGPAVVALGRAAAATELRALDFARPAMQRLSEDLGLQCVASIANGRDIIILGKAGTPVPFSPSVEVGQRLPLVPPLGIVFIAWSTPAEIDAWLRRLGAIAGDDQLPRYRAAIATVRQRGYSVALEADARARLGHEEYILGELSGAVSYHVNHLAAPVLDPDGRVVLALTLVGFTGDLDAGEVGPVGRRLVAEVRRRRRPLRSRPVRSRHRRPLRAGPSGPDHQHRCALRDDRENP